MQLMNYRKQISLSLTFAFAAMTITPAVAAFPCGEDFKKAASTTALVATLACFVRLVTKKTQPKRIYPKDDSYAELGWYVFDELLTGQMEKGERASKVVIDDLSNPQELTIQYSKVESRGVAGILYSTMKPVIIPALTFMVLFNKDFMEKSAVGLNDMYKFINNPSAPFETFMDLAKNGPQPVVVKPAAK